MLKARFIVAALAATGVAWAATAQPEPGTDPWWERQEPAEQKEARTWMDQMTYSDEIDNARPAEPSAGEAAPAAQPEEEVKPAEGVNGGSGTEKPLRYVGEDELGPYPR